MRIHVLQHVSHEGLGSTEEWVFDRGHTLTETRLYDGETPPGQQSLDTLIVMGGPMNIYEEADHPWLSSEKRFIREAVDAGKRVLGICLGAQLLADTLGGKVVDNGQREIGWFPVQPVGELTPSLSHLLGTELLAFHWHGDRFELPPGANLFATSEACPHQGFAYGEKVLGFQFHPEITEEVATAFLTAEPTLPQGPFVQSAADMLSDPERFAQQQARWFAFLDDWLGFGF